MGAGREVDAPGLGVHADRGMTLEQDPPVDPHHDAVVSGGVKLDGLRARREPHAPPADEIVPRQPGVLVEEGEGDPSGRFLDDRHRPDVEREGVGVARETIVEAAREPAGRRERVRHRPGKRQEDRPRDVPVGPEPGRGAHALILRCGPCRRQVAARGAISSPARPAPPRPVAGLRVWPQPAPRQEPAPRNFTPLLSAAQAAFCGASSWRHDRTPSSCDLRGGDARRRRQSRVTRRRRSPANEPMNSSSSMTSPTVPAPMGGPSLL